MRLTPAFAVVLLAASLTGQDVKRIALTPTSNVPSATVLHGIEKKCSGLVLTVDGSKADYLLEAVANDPHNHRHNFDLTLFAANGDVVTHSGTAMIDNAIKDICKSIGRTR